MPVDLTLLATKADAFKELRDKRLALKHEVDALYQQEKDLKHELIQFLQSADGVTGISGQLCHIKLRPKHTAQVENWDALYDHIRKTGEFELLQRRVGEGAVKERWDNGDVVPGVIDHKTDDLSVTKV